MRPYLIVVVISLAVFSCRSPAILSMPSEGPLYIAAAERCGTGLPGDNLGFTMEDIENGYAAVTIWGSGRTIFGPAKFKPGDRRPFFIGEKQYVLIALRIGDDQIEGMDESIQTVNYSKEDFPPGCEDAVFEIRKAR